MVARINSPGISMQWFLLGVVVVALLFMSSRYPRTAFSILGALALAAAVIVFSTHDDAQRGRHKLPVGDIGIENAVITPAYGGGYQLNARLLNTNPEIQLKEAVVSITMLDCPAQVGDGGDDGDGCAVIGQADERINIQIPAGQARDISRTVSFSGANPAGQLRWRFQITETRS